jgi:hypothetical protein
MGYNPNGYYGRLGTAGRARTNGSSEPHPLCRDTEDLPVPISRNFVHRCPRRLIVVFAFQRQCDCKKFVDFCRHAILPPGACNAYTGRQARRRYGLAFRCDPTYHTLS